MAVKRVLIVGGVAGGASCAARLRRLDEAAEIIMFERGPHISFANCGLPYYIGGVIEDRKKLLVQTPGRFSKRFRVDVRTESEVTRVDCENRRVEVRADGKTYIEEYDFLVLSPGAEPVKPAFPGVDLPGVFTLRNVVDTDRIVDFMEKKKSRKAVVVGGGYIGLEMVDSLHARGVEVALVEKLPQLLPVMDPEMAKLLCPRLKDKEIAVWLGDGVAGFAPRGESLEVKLESGQIVPADMVMLSIGVRPDVGLAADAGLEIGTTGGIKVDDSMRASDPNIYAVGDAVEVKHFVTGKPSLIALAGPATRQGRIAADNICGRDSRYGGTQGTSIVKVFDLMVASTGATQRALEDASISYEKIYIHPANHAGYYPGAVPMAVKALFAPGDGRLLGVQIIGPDGVDKRIDVLATAIRAGLTVYDLEELELAYAPPYGSAKDAVNMVGFIAANVLKGDSKTVHWGETPSLSDNGALLLDVRTRGEWDSGHVEGALLIPVDQLRERLGELPKDRDILIYCAVGFRAYLAGRILAQEGFKAANFSGGYKTLQASAGKEGEDAFAELQERFCSTPSGEFDGGA